MDKTELYQEAIEKWGLNAQLGMLIEEIGEVLTAYNKATRRVNGCDVNQFLEELVDLEIMIEQIKHYYKDSFDFQQYKKEKLDRLKKLLEEY